MAKLINYYPRYKEAAAIASYSYPGWHRVISPWSGPICSAIITCTIVHYNIQIHIQCSQPPDYLGSH